MEFYLGLVNLGGRGPLVRNVHWAHGWKKHRRDVWAREADEGVGATGTILMPLVPRLCCQCG